MAIIYWLELVYGDLAVIDWVMEKSLFMFINMLECCTQVSQNLNAKVKGDVT